MKEIIDFRSLGPEAQEQIRIRAVMAVLSGRSQKEVAELFKVTRKSVNQWCRTYQKYGIEGLKAKPRGTHKRGGKLPPGQSNWTAKNIKEHTPEDFKLPFSLWTRIAIGMLIATRFGITMSVCTVGRYLRRWGFTPQKPVRRAYERNSQEVDKWLHWRYPAIARYARERNAMIFFSDGTGFRSYDIGGRSYSPKGHTPVIPGSGKRFGCNMLSAISGCGGFCSMLFKKSFTGQVFIDFLTRLISRNKEMIYLIIDSHPVHRGGVVRQWFEKHRKRIKAFFLPAFSPELNPVELLNNDVKTNAVACRRPHDESELITNVKNYLGSIAHSKLSVKAYFQEDHVCYAAA
jgi:transposase